MPDDKKVYTVQGVVQAVYGPSPVDCVKGGKKHTSQKTDVQLTTPKGNPVKVTFWNQEFPDDLQEAEVSITNLKYTGKWKDTAQFSANKTTKVHVLKQAETTGAPEGVVEPEVTEPETQGEGPGDTGTDSPEDAPPFETGDGVDPPKEDPKPEPVKKRGRPAKTEPAPIADVALEVDPGAITITTNLVTEAWKIVDDTADKLVQKDPVALQAYFATVFINLGTKDYFAKNPNAGKKK